MTEHLITTKAEARVCVRCNSLVLVGIAEGLQARVDPVPLNAAGELSALCDSRATYSLTYEGLVHRDATRIAGGKLRGPILPAHICGHTIPGVHREISAFKIPPPNPDTLF